jgi:hypothetical protein
MRSPDAVPCLSNETREFVSQHSVDNRYIQEQKSLQERVRCQVMSSCSVEQVLLMYVVLSDIQYRPM